MLKLIKIKENFVFTTVKYLFPREMATLKKKRKLAAVSREKQEHTRISQSQNTFVLGNTEEYNTRVFEDIEGRVTKKLSQEFNRTESRILGAPPS